MMWHLFQMHEITDDNDLDFAIAVFRAGTQIDKEEDHSDRVGTYRGISKIGWLLELQYLECDSSNLDIYSVTNRKPLQIRKKVRHCSLVESAHTWDGTGCEFESWQCRIHIPCS